MKKLIVSLCLLAGAQLAAAGEHDHHHHTAMKSAPAATNSLFQVSSKWTTDEGKAFQLSELEGKPTVITMLYTSCATACPLLVEDMRKIEKALPEKLKGQVNFVGVSLDPKRDTVDTLAKYKKAKGVGSSWKFVRGGANDVRALAAALGVQYKREANGDYQHSFLVSVLDKKGVIVLQQAGLAQPPEKAVEAIETASK